MIMNQSALTRVASRKAVTAAATRQRGAITNNMNSMKKMMMTTSQSPAWMSTTTINPTNGGLDLLLKNNMATTTSNNSKIKTPLLFSSIPTLGMSNLNTFSDSQQQQQQQQRRYFSSSGGGGPPGGGQNLGNIFGTNPQSGSYLQDYTIDLTELAREADKKKKSLDPIIGRHEEIRRCLQILARRTKNNPVLIGQAGVGKTGKF